MPELRTNPVTGRTVVIAPDRAARPGAFAGTTEDRDQCPFCPGHEDRTPAAVAALRGARWAGDGPGWEVRVVPNKYPAFEGRSGETTSDQVSALRKAQDRPLRHAQDRPLRQAQDRPLRQAQDRPLRQAQRRPATGFHEVVIETPDHDARWSTMSEEAITSVLRAWRRRLAALVVQPGVQATVVFRNEGRRAGASLSHPHSQIVAMPFVPEMIERECDQVSTHLRAEGRCASCALLEEGASTMILEEEGAVAMAPEASWGPWETWVLPTTHLPRFEQASDAQLEAMARVSRRVMGRIDEVLARPDHNMVLRTAPVGAHLDDAFHVRLEIVPIVSAIAGFELATGSRMNPVAPEEVVRRLRAASKGSVT